MCVRIKQKKFACNHSKASAFFTTCLCFLDLCIELPLSRNPANSSLPLYFPSHVSLSLSPHSCLRTRSDQGRFPSTHAGKTVSARRAIFHLLYLSVRNTVVVTDAENLAEAFIAKKKRFIRCLANERIRDAWYSCNNIER